MPIEQAPKRTVQPSHLLAALEQTAERLGIEVRYEVIGRTSTSDPGGGLCRVRGKAIVVIDARVGQADKTAILARALAAFGLVGRGLSPRLRAALSPEVRAIVRAQAARLDAELDAARGRPPQRVARIGPRGVNSPKSPLRPLARVKPR